MSERTRAKRAVFFIAFTAMLFAQPNRAATNIFTDEAAFRTTAEAELLESFEALTPGTSATSHTLADFTINAFSIGSNGTLTPTSLDVLDNDDGYGAFATDGMQYLKGSLNSAVLTFTFDGPIAAFGVNLTDLECIRQDSVELRLDGFSAGTVSVGKDQFIGISADTTFTAVEFVFGGGFCADGIGIDEAYYVIPLVAIEQPELIVEGGGIPDAALVSRDAGPPPTLEEALAGTVEDPGDLVVLDPGVRALTQEEYAARDAATCLQGSFGDSQSVQLCGLTADDWNAVDPNGDGIETVKESLARQAMEANGINLALLPMLVAAFEGIDGLQRFSSVPLFYMSMEETAATSAPASLTALTASSSTTSGGRIRIGVAGQQNLTSELEGLIPFELMQYLPDTEISLGSHPVKVVRNGVVSYRAGFQAVPVAGRDPAYGVFEIVLDRDSDGDSIPDDTDVCPGGDDRLDADSDGTPDYCDNCDLDPENDADGDGVCGDVDNCPLVSNENQQDLDGDGDGDDCDDDKDGDGIANPTDNCEFNRNPGQEDFDQDGAGNACDLDDDGDGVLDADDQCVPTPNGEVVDAAGCSIAQLCPCNNEWKNHGAYVSCVAHASDAFLAIDLITWEEKDEIVSAAGEYRCGHKNK